MANESEKLPYHAEMTLFEKILEDLKTAGSEGMNLDTLWVDVGAKQNNLRSFSLGLGKYLGLLDSDNKKAWLTNLGTILRYMSKNDRSKKLALRLPSRYLTMFKWIRDAEEIRSNDLKLKFVENWGTKLSKGVLDRVIATFLNYCGWLGIIDYQGRGNQAKATITDFGKQVLDLPRDEHENKKREQDDNNKKGKEEIKLPTNATYPIIIKTNDREFEWDVKTSEDWYVVDSVIASIKKGCKVQQGPKKEDGKGK